MVYIVVLVKLVNKWRTSQSSCLLLCPGHTGLVASLLANEAWSFSLIALVTIYNKAVGYDLHIHTKQVFFFLIFSFRFKITVTLHTAGLQSFSFGILLKGS